MEKEDKPKPTEVEKVTCLCGKIISERSREQIIIRCRHCKRKIIINTNGLSRITYQ